MTTKQLCPHCGAPFAVPSNMAAGKKLVCRHCHGRIELPTKAEAPNEDYELVEAEISEQPGPEAVKPEEEIEVLEELPEIDRSSRPRSRSERTDLPKKRKKKPPERERIVDPGLLKIGGGVMAALVAFGVVIYLLSGLFGGGPDPIPDDQWREVVVENRFKVLLPGPATNQTQNVMGIQMKSYLFSPSNDSAYVVGYTEGNLPAHRANLPLETLLNDSCNGSLEMMKRMDPDSKELSRTSVQCGEHTGKELVVYVPRGKGRSISRVFYIHGHLYIISAVGKGMRESHANVQKLFNSFVPLEVAKPEPEPSKEIPPERWQELTVPNRFKAFLPGPAHPVTQTLRGGVEMQIYRATPEIDLFFGVGYTTRELPPHLAAMSPEDNLNEACESHLAAAREADPSVKEVSRTPVRTGAHSGKELVFELPQSKSRTVLRVYLVHGRRYVLTASGKEMREGQGNAKRLFDSFVPLEVPQAGSKKEAIKGFAKVEPPIMKESPFRKEPIPEPPSAKIAFEIELPKIEVSKLRSGFNPSPLLNMAFGRDGKSLTVVTASEQVIWFDVDSRQQTQTRRIATPAGVNGAAISADGDTVALHKHGGLLYLWQKGEKAETVLNTDEGGGITQYKATFSPDGETLCTTNGFAFVKVWDLKKGQKVAELKPFDTQTASLAFSPDGSLLACADTQASIWSPKTHKKLATLAPKGQFYMTELEFSPDGKSLIGVSDRTVYQWALSMEGQDTAEGKSIQNIERITHVKHSPDGKYLVGVFDNLGLRVWDAKTLKRQGDLSFAKTGGIAALAFRPTDSKLAVCCGGRILFLDLAEQKWD